MKPVFFSGCFGWLHEGRGTTGVVMCAAFGHENMTAHRGWRLLAEKLAARGFHVLRFDYPGTGDSSGGEDDPDRLAAWRGSIRTAVNYLRSVSEVEEVVLIGLRLGATLALLAADDLNQVCGFVVLAPVFSGKTYLRELRLRSNAWEEAHLIEVERSSHKSLNVLGERLGEETIKELSSVSLRNIALSLKPLLILNQTSDVSSICLLEQLKEAGRRVTVEDFPGYVDYLEDSVSSVIPYAELRAIVDWCEQLNPKGRMSSRLSQTSKTVLRSEINNQRLFLSRSVEHAIRFGSRKRLFGILSCPLEFKLRSSSPVIMLNTGFGRHVGDGRIFTILARRLAAEGITSLRMNLTGFGDSDSVGDGDADPYATDGFQDVKEAVDYLEQVGYCNPVVVGICSGAFTAFHAAVEEPRIYSVILVNIQMFLRKQGFSLKIKTRRQRRPFSFYLRAMMHLKVWRRLFRGELEVGAVLLTLFRRLIETTRLLVYRRIVKFCRRDIEANQVVTWFNKLSIRDVQINLFYSDGDPGLTELAIWFGRKGKLARRFRNVRLNVLKNADHALFDYQSKMKVIEMIVELVSGDIG